MTRWWIHVDFTRHKSGGGLAFLTALRNWFSEQSILASGPAEASIILFNSHHDIDEVLKSRREYAKAVFVHRMDGPMRLYNKPGDLRDQVAWDANAALADATVFQSRYSEAANRAEGCQPRQPVTVIGNAADGRYFSPGNAAKPAEKLRLVACSWSANRNKGFDVLAWLDANLDWTRFEMEFLGNSDLEFKNIRGMKPAGKEAIAERLRAADVYVAASKKDPCSNALLEAMACGLPVLARNDGGHPELTGDAGLLFDDPAQIPALLEKLRADYAGFVNRLHPPTIQEIGKAYLAFGEKAIRGERRPWAEWRLSLLLKSMPLLLRAGF